MKILVTGGAGFIGSAIIRKAIADGHEVINIDALTYAANLSNLESLANHKRYHFIHGNICDQNLINNAFTEFRPDSIMHLAAESHVDRSISGPADFIRTNILGTFSLLEAARQYYESLSIEKQKTFRFHHISTDEVYGDLDETQPAFTETTAYNPSSPYSASKAAADHLVRAWARTYDLPCIVTNTSNNYGPYQFPEKLIPVIILNAIQNKSIPIYGKGQNIRDWLHVEDHAEALLLVLEKGEIGETYNIGGDNEWRNIDIAHAICDILDEKVPQETSYRNLIKFVTDRPGHDRRYAINSIKMSEALGWKPRLTGAEGFQLTVEWYLKNQSWWYPILEKKLGDVKLGDVTSSNVTL